MPTRFYLRDVLAANAPTAGEKSTANPVNTLGANNATGTQETRSLLAAKGSTQTSFTFNSDATTSARDNYLGRFTSLPLAAQTFGSGTWTAALALSENNASANSQLALALYVWRPGTSSVVGFVYDSHTVLGIEWGATEDGIVATFTGANVTAQVGDVLVLEVWRVAPTQGMASAYPQILYFDGATDVVDATTADAASYIESPVNLLAVSVALPNNYQFISCQSAGVISVVR